MTLEETFSICSTFAAIGWLLLIALPRWWVTERLVVSGYWSLALSLVYLVLIARNLPGAPGGFGSLDEVRALFGTEALLLAGWVHYLAFDLLAGAIALKQAKECGIPHLLMVPILLLTFLLGPIGLAAFFVAKSVWARRIAEVTG